MGKKVDITKLSSRRKRHKREVVKNPPCRILIVSEGTKTEPNYFEEFELAKNKYFVYECVCDGSGDNTINVVDIAIERKEKAERTAVPYDSVWAVFDRDSFPKERFNSAIEKAKANGINAAWSNEAFELWYLYHFCNRVSSMSRSDYQDAITRAVRASGKYMKKKPYKYKKNATDNYRIMTLCGSVESAIKWSEKKHAEYEGRTDYANHNPCTLVYKLVKQLMNRDEDLIASVMDRINGGK